MITTYMKEFVAIVNALIRAKKGKIKGEYLLINKDEIISLLRKNAYDTETSKLKVWKGLNWIDTDEDRLTKRVRDDEGKQVPCVKISMKVHKTLLGINDK